MSKILIISHNEICYNARLLKAADFFHEKKWDVTVFNPVTGIASEEIYQKVIGKRSWKIIENDITKRSTISKTKWLFNSIFNKVIRVFHDKLGIRIFNKYYMNKGLLFMPQLDKSYDYILIHLIDNLPFAAALKKETGAKLIYDSQEYFVGQYAAFDKQEFNWVKWNEGKFIKEVDVLLATTNVMKAQLIEDYQLKIPSFRVRNVPTKSQTEYNRKPEDTTANKPLQLVWHGMAIYFDNRRGVHILLKAIAQCKENVQLILQGNFPEDQQSILKQYKKELSLDNKVLIKPAADPDTIVGSLVSYDVGLTGELPEEMNQQLTSSNKLFDYIHAGLAVISSNALGLAETIDEFEVGLTYQPGNVEELSRKIDHLARNREVLDQYKENSHLVAKKLYWEDDYEKVFKTLEKLR